MEILFNAIAIEFTYYLQICMSQSLIQDTFYTFLWSIVLLLWLLLDLIYSLFSLCSVKPSSAHKLYVAIAKRKGRGPSKLGPRLPLRLTSRASKKRDLETGSHAIGFLYRCRTFPIFNLIFFFLQTKNKPSHSMYHAEFSPER